jgi:Kdo2-lipid IVA lauroyltransferase/acyltransferase
MIKRYLSHPLQGLASHIFFLLVQFLPISWASAIGGWLGRTIGPGLGLTRRARKNLAIAFPELSTDEMERLVLKMWDNLGRTVMEYPLLGRIRTQGANPHVEIIRAKNIDLMRDDDKPGIFFSGHIANWEIPAICISAHGLTSHLVYRAPNNPYVEKLFQRRHLKDGTLIPKGAKGARIALKALAQGGHLGMLVDQKMNDGIAVPLFGHDAMTAPALAQFALKFNCPVIPIRVERLQGVKFRVTCFPPLEIKPSGDRQADILTITTEVNRILESWIREQPAQWLWLHNRWPDNIT